MRKLVWWLSWMPLSWPALGQLSPRYLVQSTGDMQAPDVATNGSNVYVTYVGGPAENQAVLFTYSSDGGTSFSNPIQVATAAGEPRNAAVAAGGGALYVAWAQVDTVARTGRIMVSRRSETDTDKTFSVPVAVGAQGIALNPRLAVDGAGTVHLAWSCGGEAADQRQVCFARSRDAGRTFEAARLLSAQGTVGMPNVLWSDSGLVVSWRNLAANAGTVYWSSSADGGDSFSAPAAVAPTAGTTATAGELTAVSVVPGTGRGLLYTDVVDERESLYFVSGPGGQLGGSARLLADSAGSPSLTYAGTGLVAAAAWYGPDAWSSQGGQGIVAACTADGVNFATPALAVSLETPVRQLRTAMGADGMLHALAIEPGSQQTGLVYGRFRCPAMFSAASITNAASQVVGPVAPGALATIYGIELGGEALLGFWDSKSGYLSDRLGDVEVTFDGVRAPLLYVSALQVNLQVPFEVAGKAVTKVRVNRGGLLSAEAEVPVRASSAAFFTMNGGGKGGIAARNYPDGNINGPEHPIARGGVLTLYANGQGLVSPAVNTGQPGPGQEPLPRSVAQVTVLFGGKAGPIYYAGLAPNFVGLLQVNAGVPMDAATGTVEIKLRVGDDESPAGTTVVIQ